MAPPKQIKRKGRAGRGKAASPDPLLLKAQILLARARFSPGAFDARDGKNFRGALAAFAQDRGLAATKTLNQEIFDALQSGGGDPVLIDYTVTEADVSGPFAETIPRKMEEQADLKALDYTSAREMLAERFHMSQDLLAALNPGSSFDKAGVTIVVAAVPAMERGKPTGQGKARAKSQGTGQAKNESRDAAKASDKPDVKSGDEPRPEGRPTEQDRPVVTRIEVDKASRQVRAFDREGKLRAFYPASIGSKEKPAPSGSAKVETVAYEPTYTYDPKYAFKGVKATEKFMLQPGPNNPVGLVWIDLSIPSYGIHGTPDPEKVGKTESHGCIRLTNWDVRDLAMMVERGAKVEFKDE
ncbi:L,D-transpeptidase [Methylobacterium sp.]|uniref:L,D-transpeptidase n=1 Tax=Methylobacterium sp. TaxID=409 RepID=UPI0025CBF99F|nr:L,D-transpeptidase [Methylobacterium sp.]